MEFNSYVKSEKQKIRKQKIETFKNKSKSIIDSFLGHILDYIKENPYQTGLWFVVCTIGMPFLTIPLMYLFSGNFIKRIAIYLLVSIIIIGIVEFSFEDENFGRNDWEKISKLFFRDLLIFFIVNITTLLYGYFLLNLIQ